MSQEKSQKPNDERGVSDDPFIRLKSIAYHMSQPPGKADDPELADFIRYARFQLAAVKRILYWDPVWDNYTDEQILIEYYAMLFDKDPKFRTEYEAMTGTPIEDDIDWMEREIAKNQAEHGAPKKEEGKPQEDVTEAGLEEFEVTPDSLVKEDNDGIFD